MFSEISDKNCRLCGNNRVLRQTRRCVGCVMGGSTRPRQVPLKMVLFDSAETAEIVRDALVATWARCRTWKARRVFEAVELPGGQVLALLHVPLRRFPEMAGARVLDEAAAVS